MTIVVYRHLSPFKNFKRYSLRLLVCHGRKFPGLVSYPHFVYYR